ncbi:hypothetical protein M0805_002333 [Coniferiporia weirii]|nr:hypothetical protein M0805_002333 [Coniferiporia weirii]
MSDPRFARLRTDPRFRRPSRAAHKVVVDERFKSVLGRPGKKSKGARVDKYGRRISDSHESDNLKRFYRLDTGDQQSNEDPPDVPDLARGQVLLESSDEEDEEALDDVESGDDGEVVLGHHASKPIPVLADEEYVEVDLNEDDEAYADLDAQAAAYANEHADEDTAEGTRTKRLAVVNLDWHHVRASHLFKIFSSLVSPTAPVASVVPDVPPPPGNGANAAASSTARVARGKVLSVRIYPSEFGKARMKKEEIEGPPKEIFKKSRRDDDDGTINSLIQEDEGDEYDEKALRKYQLEQLRYYYAVVTCNTVEAASHILSELDGTELERSANVFDLSFVPDDMAFDEEFRDEATPATETTGMDYQRLDFSTEALRHSKVKLNWDEDDPERNKVTRRALSRKEIEEGDYRAFIASSGSEDEDEEEKGKLGDEGKKRREKLRQLLLGGDERDRLPEGWGADAFGDDKDGEGEGMEITFMPGLSEANVAVGDETTLEKYKRKQKEKRQQRKKEQKEGTGEQKPPESKNSKGAEDEFFDRDGSSESEKDGVDTKSRKKGSGRKARSKSPVETRPATEAELELLVAPDDASTGQKHFDMKSILKLEKGKGKKRGKRGKKMDKDNGPDEIQEDFQINVKDERFSALHEDHTFAIDPSNPHFKKTKSMAALLEERTKRQHTNRQADAGEEYSSKTRETVGTQSLRSLVESVKRKSAQVDGKGSGKRRKL